MAQGTQDTSRLRLFPHLTPAILLSVLISIVACDALKLAVLKSS